MATFRKTMLRFIRYLRRTYRNKIVALVLILLGVLSTMVDGDATALVFMSLIAVPVFFMNKNCIVPVEES